VQRYRSLRWDSRIHHCIQSATFGSEKNDLNCSNYALADCDLAPHYSVHCHMAAMTEDDRDDTMDDLKNSASFQERLRAFAEDERKKASRLPPAGTGRSTTKSSPG
jgi:hypothetical protein